MSQLNNSPFETLWFSLPPLELRAEVEVIEQMSSSGSSSSSDSGSCSGSGDDSSSSDAEPEGSPTHHHSSPNRLPVVNGTDKPQSSNQLMNTLSK